LFLPPPDGLGVVLGQPAGFGPLFGGMGAGRPPPLVPFPPLFEPLAFVIIYSLKVNFSHLQWVYSNYSPIYILKSGNLGDKNLFGVETVLYFAQVHDILYQVWKMAKKTKK